MGWFTGMGTLKILALTSVASIAIGTYAGIRWQKGVQYDFLEAKLTLVEEQAAQSLINLNKLWLVQAEQAKIDIREWQVQNSLDEDLIQQLIAGQTVIRGKFDEINQEITITTDFGMCTFSPDAIRMLRESSAAANGTTEP